VCFPNKLAVSWRGSMKRFTESIKKLNIWCQPIEWIDHEAPSSGT
jgi:hypothetical protein